MISEGGEEYLSSSLNSSSKGRDEYSSDWKRR